MGGVDWGEEDKKIRKGGVGGSGLRRGREEKLRKGVGLGQGRKEEEKNEEKGAWGGDEKTKMRKGGGGEEKLRKGVALGRGREDKMMKGLDWCSEEKKK